MSRRPEGRRDARNAAKAAKSALNARVFIKSSGSPSPNQAKLHRSLNNFCNMVGA